jgi:hypothetical protein
VTSTDTSVNSQTVQSVQRQGRSEPVQPVQSIPVMPPPIAEPIPPAPQGPTGAGPDPLGARPDPIVESVSVQGQMAPDLTQGRTEPIQTEPVQSLKNQDSRKVLKLSPSRFAVINIESRGPRHRRCTARSQETEAEAYGVEAITITTTSEQTIVNPQEHEAAKKLQADIGYQLRRLGTRIVDGVIVFPLSKETEFDSTRESCKELARAFNTKSSHYKVMVNVVKLAAMVSDEESIARMAAYEINQTLKDVTLALKEMDVQKIREAAQALKYKASAISAGTEQGVILAAVNNLRDAAKRIARDVGRKGSDIESVRKELDTSAIESARFMFASMAEPVELGDTQSNTQSPIDTSRFSSI